jgi:hypothetical protein
VIRRHHATAQSLGVGRYVMGDDSFASTESGLEVTH